ncbi:MAG: hypothetical protein WCC38_16700, partial [Pseudonocardiaceae bacterium]
MAGLRVCTGHGRLEFDTRATKRSSPPARRARVAPASLRSVRVVMCVFVVVGEALVDLVGQRGDRT